MPQLVEMDRHVSLFEQMEHQQQLGPVILINTFTVEPHEAEQLQEAWARGAAFMKQQPGFISTQLHRGIGGSSVFFNYAVWESVEDFKRAFTNPQFQAKMQDYPPSAAASPHLVKKVAVAGICVD
jgi:heme-degrading monooxygenase HmoA